MRAVPALTAVCVAALLTACGGTPPPEAGTPQPASDQTAAAPPPAPAAPEPPPPRAAPSTPVERAALPQPPEPPVNADPAQFLSQGTDRLTRTLGQPTLIRRDGPAEVWQYAGRGCVLDVFFYDQGGAGFQARHVELRAAGLPESARRACLAEMIRANGRAKG